MARVSRKQQIADRNNHIVAQKSMAPKAYKAGLYIRLSVFNSGIGEECESLENQETLLRDFVAAQKDIEVVKVYSDNGETGTDFERPNFNRMMDDVRSGKINCIIVKDLSRFGRNYIETGEYIEKIFPFLEVRFIAVNDEFDNLNPDCDSTIHSLKNLMNEVYAKDISQKIHSALDAKRQNGEFNVKNAPYGYSLSGDLQHPYTVDEEAAETVRLIFRMKLAGESSYNIARYLESQGILTVLRYMKRKGMVKKCNENAHWDVKAINRILTTPCYLGHMVQGKTVARLYANMKEAVLPPDQWIITESVNEPIVDQATYNAVQQIMAEQKRKYHEEYEKRSKHYCAPVLPGIVVCACCGKTMMRKKRVLTSQKGSKTIYYYLCRNYVIHKEVVCPNSKYFPEQELLAIVWQHIKTEIMIFNDFESRLQKVVHSSPYKQQLASIETEIHSTELRLKKLNSLLLSLFETYSVGDMSDQEYMSIRERYENEIEVKNTHLSELRYRKAEMQNQANIQNEWTMEIAKYRTAECLTKEMASALIERIELYPDKKVNIILKYQDAYSTAIAQIDKMEEEYCG